MPRFKFSFERDVTETEGFERIIEAPSRAEAEAAANNLTIEFNHSCPDDCDTPGGTWATARWRSSIVTSARRRRTCR